MKPWRRRKSWSPHSGDNATSFRWKITLAWLLCVICPGRRIVSPLRCNPFLRYVVMGVAALVLFGQASSFAGEPVQRPPTVIIVIPQLSWTQLRAADAASIHSVIAESAVGLMPVAAPSDRDADRTYVTLGAGRAAVGARLRGKAMAGGGIQVDVAPLLSANQRARTSARPGLLGSRLHDLGLKTAVLVYGEREKDRGAGDAQPSLKLRQPGLLPYELLASVSVLMDEQGRVDGGGLRAAEVTPLGKSLNAQSIIRELTALSSQDDVVLVDLIGTGLPVADEVVGGAVELLRERRGRLFIISPLSPPQTDLNLRTLGYLIERDFATETGPGLFVSRSTRWPGLVTAGDFAPTLLAQDGGSPNRMGGRVMTIAPTSEAATRLDRLDAMLLQRRRLQVTVLPLYGVYWVLLTAGALAAALRRPLWLRKLALPGLFGALFPIGLLLAPIAGPGLIGQTLTAVAIALVLAVLTSRTRGTAPALAAAMFIGAAAICLDVLTGSHLMRMSPLGFGVMWGARFYGLGNEYAGVLGAMTVIGLGALLQLSPNKGVLAALLGVLTALVIGAPWWGANWGGYFALAAGLISLWVILTPSKWRAALIGLSVLVAGALVPAALDLLRPGGERSHLGLTAAALFSGQTSLLGDMVMRKLAMNWYTIQQAGGWWILSPLPVVAVWAVTRKAALREMRFLCAGLWSALATALVALVVNDSGIVSMACAMMVTWGALLFVVARAVKT